MLLKKNCNDISIFLTINGPNKKNKIIKIN